ncbi:hypothetical protein [Helicobacter ailurogastricus]|uniref:hypothetical protein n=1 Tax=Helicobacter ailurogastricus TaxID=1578720 RepID=UPI00244D8A8E|nr:hypothetical protein [Helicobacter ailurogastricus]GMB92253.1 CAAX protease [Helicobacter ailurogastricus]
MLDLETLLSLKRLGSYNGDLQAHLDNLNLIGKYTPKIALVEIALRNSLDYLLSAKDTEWINNSTDPRVIQMRAEILEACKATALSHDGYLSKMTLGMVIYVIRQEKLLVHILDATKIELQSYDPSNKKRHFINGRKSHLNHYHKAEAVLSLFHILRNRCYHWENITKVRVGKNGQTYPRLTTKILDNFIGIHPSKIGKFLDDLLRAFSGDLLGYASH